MSSDYLWCYTYHRSAKGTYHTTSEPVDVQRPSLSLNGGVYTTAQTVTITKLEGSTVYPKIRKQSHWQSQLQ